MSDKSRETPYPWQQVPWRQLNEAWRQGRLPHALLIEGPEGLGKTDFALNFAAELLGLPNERDPQTQLSGVPDFHLVTPEEGKKLISIDQLRALSGTLTLSAHRGHTKLALIVPADRMTIAAANSLLKTLEEPTPGSQLLLVTAHPATLPPTVISRCQRVRISRPPFAEALDWVETTTGVQDTRELLEFVDGAPLAAAALLQADEPPPLSAYAESLAGVIEGDLDPVAVAAEWSRTDNDICLRWLTGWVTDLIRYRTTGQPRHERHEPLISRLQYSLGHLSLEGLFDYLDQIGRVATGLRGQVNAQLAFERLVIPWSHPLEVYESNRWQNQES